MPKYRLLGFFRVFGSFVHPVVGSKTTLEENRAREALQPETEHSSSVPKQQEL